MPQSLEPVDRLTANHPAQDNQLETLQHFIELGRLSASLLHEISGPLTTALLYLEQAHEGDSANVRKARHSLGLLRNYVEAARQQLRHDTPHTMAFCLHPQVKQLKTVVLPLARQAHVQLVFEDIPHYRLMGDPIKFQQILANLVMNAIDAYSGAADGLARPVRVRIYGAAHSITLKVIDWGEGIAPSQLPHIFEPFYSTKAQNQQGLGIGLTLVKDSVMNDFHGTVQVSSSQRQGTQFILRLPALPYSSTHLRRKNPTPAILT